MKTEGKMSARFGAGNSEIVNNIPGNAYDNNYGPEAQMVETKTGFIDNNDQKTPRDYVNIEQINRIESSYKKFEIGCSGVIESGDVFFF